MESNWLRWAALLGVCFVIVALYEEFTFVISAICINAGCWLLARGAPGCLSDSGSSGLSAWVEKLQVESPPHGRNQVSVPSFIGARAVFTGDAAVTPRWACCDGLCSRYSR